MFITFLPLSGILIVFFFIYSIISSVDSILFAQPGLAQLARNSNTDNNISTSNNMENRVLGTIKIFQQAMFNLNHTLTPDLIAQDYVLSLDMSGSYSFDKSDNKLQINNSSFSGTLFGIENLAAMHEPQIQMRLDNIQYISLSQDFKTINYNAIFVDQKSNRNLTAGITGTLQFRNPVCFVDILPCFSLIGIVNHAIDFN